MERKLVTIRKVSKLVPIEGADFIERATVDGWDLVVKKGEFSEGDLGVYFEIDSVLPEDPRFAFLKKMTITRGGTGYRIKTIKLRKQISQGLLLPISSFEKELEGCGEGDDVTEDLGVWLYEPYVRNGVNSNAECKSIGKKIFPDFLRKTDQERIQNKMHYFEDYKDHKWEATKKLDGSSMTIWNYKDAYHVPLSTHEKKEMGYYKRFKYWLKTLFTHPDTFGVCSRNINLRDKDGNAFWDMAKQIKAQSLLANHNVAIQGELIGPNIQSNHEKVDRNYFYVFDIFDIDKQEYMLPDERVMWLVHNDPTKRMKTVPHVDVVKIFEKCQSIDDMQKYVEGESINEGTISEGMVFKSMTTKGLSFKCINNNYLLKCEK